ncbi:MAG TPA: NAD(P)/FAD-dependent oxidoreductase [Bacilli bacterium]|nr:NAD(P)/FAD-dependent oxidoreductase [Bacilli bacterium]HQA55767.1 NAD(P)/FAD-dependent oxidoreductase [Bacilli bacterium]
MKIVDLVIIGGGSAGMAAAIQAKKEGVDNLLILEKNDTLGGILNQCIHNGFGLTEFKEELTGPEYLQRFVDQVHELDIPYKLSSAVINITRDKVVSYSNPVDGSVSVQAKAIVLATGCYERNAGAIQLPGDRCSGIITAGTAQKYLNIHGYLVGKRVVILGSGDIGLIMARRLTLEGAKVVCVAEIMPYSNGLNRNIAQCLNDYNIPLYLSTSVSRVIGKGRLQKVILSNVDDNFKFIPGTEMEIPCDTLILSVGLVPYVSLLENIGVPMSSTKGALVNEHMETMIPGIFTCGNCLHVHDVVDFVTDEGRLAGHGAALYLQNLLLGVREINVYPNSGVSYVVPQKVNLDNQEDVTFKFRVQKPVKDVFVLFESNNVIISKVFKSALIPSEMIMIKLNRDKLANVTGDITVHLEGR